MGLKGWLMVSWLFGHGRLTPTYTPNASFPQDRSYGPRSTCMGDEEELKSSYQIPLKDGDPKEVPFSNSGEQQQEYNSNYFHFFGSRFPCMKKPCFYLFVRTVPKVIFLGLYTNYHK